MQIATFAGGCFWCTEAVFQRLRGVRSVLPGYTGGQISNPTYEQVCTGETGHAEAIQIEFDEVQISFTDLLDIFFHTHNLTTLNRQGNDVGTQYRSTVFYHDETQKHEAEDYIAKLNKDAEFSDSIVTTLEPATELYVAEDYHLNYYNSHKEQTYCDVVISPKIAKLTEKYADKLSAQSL